MIEKLQYKIVRTVFKLLLELFSSVNQRHEQVKEELKGVQSWLTFQFEMLTKEDRVLGVVSDKLNTVCGLMNKISNDLESIL